MYSKTKVFLSRNFKMAAVEGRRLLKVIIHIVHIVVIHKHWVTVSCFIEWIVHGVFITLIVLGKRVASSENIIIPNIIFELWLQNYITVLSKMSFVQCA